MCWKEEENTETQQLHKFGVDPQNPDDKKKYTWKGFWRNLVPRLWRQPELGESFEKAKIHKTEGEGDKLKAEAKEAAARADLAKAQAAREEGGAMSEHFKMIDEHFGNLNEDQRTELKFLELIKNNAYIQKQIEKVNDKGQHLHLTKGFSVQFLSSANLPKPEDEKTEPDPKDDDNEEEESVPPDPWGL